MTKNPNYEGLTEALGSTFGVNVFGEDDNLIMLFDRFDYFIGISQGGEFVYRMNREVVVYPEKFGFKVVKLEREMCFMPVL